MTIYRHHHAPGITEPGCEACAAQVAEPPTTQDMIDEAMAEDAEANSSDDYRMSFDAGSRTREVTGTLGEIEAWAIGVKDALGIGTMTGGKRRELGDYEEGFHAAVDALLSLLDHQAGR